MAAAKRSSVKLLSRPTAYSESRTARPLSETRGAPARAGAEWRARAASRHSAARTGRAGAASRCAFRRSATMKAISIDCSALRRGSQ